jgi:hypothetical protein
MPAIRRRPGAASVAVLGGFVLAVGAAQGVAPEWARAAGLDVWNAAAARDELAAGVAAGERMDARNARIVTQMVESDAVADRVAAGLPLAAAVAELEAVNADRPGWECGLRATHYDAPTHRHRIARYVAVKLAARTPDPFAWAVLAARLDAEYRAL